jgi:hypothetical protein
MGWRVDVHHLDGPNAARPYKEWSVLARDKLRWAATSLMLASASPASTASAANGCDRACLYAFVDAYLEALDRRDPAALPVTDGIKFSENNAILPLGEGAWKSITRVKTNYNIRAADSANGQVGYVGIVEIGKMATMFALRLKIVDRRISEIETILPGAELPAEFPEQVARLDFARPIFGQMLPKAARIDRATMRSIANSYYEGIEQQDSNPVPFSGKCHRVENGLAMTNNPNASYPIVATDGVALPNFAAMGCMDLANSGLWDADLVNARRFPVIDPEQGIVFAYGFYQTFAKAPCSASRKYGRLCPVAGAGNGRNTLFMVEVFKIEHSRIEAMESVWKVAAPTWGSVWWRPGSIE